jgi:hypothetical protein
MVRAVHKSVEGHDFFWDPANRCWYGRVDRHDVYIRGDEEGLDESHWRQARQVLGNQKQFLRRAINYTRLHRPDKKEWALWHWIGCGAWGDIHWFGFGAPGLPANANEFHIALELIEDDYGLWKVWFMLVNGEWHEDRLTRENW